MSGQERERERERETEGHDEDNEELCNWFVMLEFSFFFFTFIEKLYPPVCSTVPASLQAQSRRAKG